MRKAFLDLKAVRNTFEARRTALKANLVESHTAANVAVVKLSAFVPKFACFGLQCADINEKVKVSLAQVESIAVLLIITFKKSSWTPSHSLSARWRV